MPNLAALRAAIFLSAKNRWGEAYMCPPPPPAVRGYKAHSTRATPTIAAPAAESTALTQQPLQDSQHTQTGKNCFDPFQWRPVDYQRTRNQSSSRTQKQSFHTPPSRHIKPPRSTAQQTLFEKKNIRKHHRRSASTQHGTRVVQL